METVIAAFSLAGFLACVAVMGMIFGYNVELTFHPPIFIKLKFTRNREPETQQALEFGMAIPIQQADNNAEKPSPDEK